MKAEKGRAALLGALCLVGLCVMAAAAAAEPGSQSDPLVTLSYLNQTVMPSLLTKVDEAVRANEKALVDKLNAAIDGYSKQMDAALKNGGGTGGSAAYSVVSLNAGQTMKLEIGCEVMLRVGNASCVSSSSPGLIDTTAGATLNGGEALVKNHLYMATIAGRSVKAADSVKVLVRGGYSIA